MKLIKLISCTALGVVAFSSLASAQGKKWEKIVIATESSFAPWSMQDSSGNLIGYEIDMANELCKRMQVKCEIISQDWDGLMPGLTGKKFDAIIAGMSITEERKKSIDFSRSYAQVANGFLTAKSSDTAKMPYTGEKFDLNDKEKSQKIIDEIKTFFKDKKVGVQVGTTHEAFINTYMKDVISGDVLVYPTVEAHDIDLEAGRVDIVSTDATTINGTLEQDIFKNDYVLVGPGFVGGVLGEGSGIGLRKGDTELKKMFDDAIESMRADGSLKEMAVKWFKMDVTPVN